MDTSGPLLERQHSNPYAKFGCAISECAKIFWNEPEMRHKLAIRMGGSYGEMLHGGAQSNKLSLK